MFRLQLSYCTINIIGFFIFLLLLFYLKNTKKMLHSFITSPDNFEIINLNNCQKRCSNNNHDTVLRLQIKNIIDQMPSLQICQQAAINIGLPSNMLDFDRLIKKSQAETNVNTLTFTIVQLKTLRKQSLKLKKLHSCKAQVNSRKQKQPQRAYKTVQSQNQSIKSLGGLISMIGREKTMQEKKLIALEEEALIREKKQNFYSMEKSQKKEDYLKKRIEKVRNFNKRALKIYKNFKQKQQMQKQVFKIQTIFDPEKKNALQNAPHHFKEQRHLKKSIFNFHESKNISLFQQDFPFINYSSTNRRRKEPFDYKLFKQLRNNENYQKFTEVRKREAHTRQRKRQIESQKEVNALIKLIKKQQKLQRASSSDQKKREVKIKHQHRQSSQKKSFHQQQLVDLEKEIKAKCEQKIFKKQILLQQKVNKVRQNLKKKEERLFMHKIRQQRQHQLKMEMDEQFMKSYSAKVNHIKNQIEMQQQKTIKHRLEESIERQNYRKMVQNISKMNDTDLKKQLGKIKKRELFKSLINLHMA